MSWIEKISKKQALVLCFVGYLGLTVSIFGVPDVNIEANLIAVWNEIIKAVDPKRIVDDSIQPKDFANF